MAVVTIKDLKKSIDALTAEVKSAANDLREDAASLQSSLAAVETAINAHGIILNAHAVALVENGQKLSENTAATIANTTAEIAAAQQTFEMVGLLREILVILTPDEDDEGPAAPEPFICEITDEKIGAFTFDEKGEVTMVDGIIFDVPAKPAKLPTDAVKRIVRWSWDRQLGNGPQSQPEVELAVDRTTGVVTPDKVVGLMAPQGADVHVDEVDIDDNENEGKTTSHDFKAVDKIGPVSPDEFAAEITDEKIDAFPDDVL